MIAAVVTDIEGTTTSISFVHDTLFPYARARLADAVRDPRYRGVLTRVATEAGVPDEPGALLAALTRWMDEDRKIGPLKELQGLLWEAGYADGSLVSHVYPDVPPALRRWRERGIRLAVYSSGSVHAQHLLFGHTFAGDLRPLFSGWFDTTVGPKRAAASYATIAEQLGAAPGDVLFLSDVVEELDAAAAAGMRTTQLVRSPAPVGRHPVATDFSTIRID